MYVAHDDPLTPAQQARRRRAARAPPVVGRAPLIRRSSVAAAVDDATIDGSGLTRPRSASCASCGRPGSPTRCSRSTPPSSAGQPTTTLSTMRRQPDASGLASSSSPTGRSWSSCDMATNTTSPTDDASVPSCSSQRRAGLVVAEATARQHAGQPRQGEVEVAGAARAPRPPRRPRAPRRSRRRRPARGPAAPSPNGKSSTATCSMAASASSNATDLAQGQGEQHERLALLRAGALVALDDLLGERERLLARPEVHRHAGGALQRHAELAELLAEGDRLLDAALGVGLLAERGAGPVERAEGLHDAVAVVGLAEPGQGPLGELLGLGEAAGPQPQVGEQRRHHQARPRVGPAVGVALDGDGQRLGLVEPALEVQDVGHQPVGPDHAVGVAERLEALLGFGELHLGVAEVAGLERRPRPGSGGSTRGRARRRCGGRCPSPR